MPFRRKGDPVNIQCIWDSIQYLKWAKVLTDPQNVVKRLINNDGYTQNVWDTCIDEALSDKLIENRLRRDMKTPVLGFPTAEKPALDGRDWYCFECHLAGDVEFCKNKSCHRVFHKNCITKSALVKYRLFKNIFANSDSTVFLKTGLPSKRKTLCLEIDGIEMVGDDGKVIGFTQRYDQNLCIVCNTVTLENFSLQTSELNHLLKYVLHRIRSWVPENITHKMDGSDTPPKWETEANMAIRANHLFFQHKDMSVIESKINSESYTNCNSFLTDVLSIRHNIGIFHGDDSQEYAATDFMLRDTLHDLGEIIGCVDCYKHSNEQVHNNWFALPCRTGHTLVWAKQKGYSYWPAKVVKETETQCDVRFFGGKHERALITKQLIKPITHPKESLKLKKTAFLMRAIEEMEFHQKLCQNSSALADFIATSCTPKKLISPIAKKPKQTLTTKTPTQKKGTKNQKIKEEKIEPTDLPLLSDDPPTKKRKSSTLKVVAKKEQPETPEIGSKVIGVSERTRMNRACKLKGRESTDVGSNAEEVPDKPGKKTPAQKVSKRPAAKPKSIKNTRSSTKSNNNVVDKEIITISDAEDNVYTFSGNLTMYAMGYEDNNAQMEQVVTSSTECRSQENVVQNHEMQQLDHPFCNEVEMMRRILESLPNKKEVISSAMSCMQKEIDRITEKHNDTLKRLFESHNSQISETKKKQWCYYCEQDAIYHCCWNTAYCSTICQQQHWQEEHKKVCRRKK